MSSLVAGALTTVRKNEDPQDPPEPGGLGTYIDIFASLVPAEVLALHALVMSYGTDPVKDAAGKESVIIVHDKELDIAFFVLLALSSALYFGGRFITAPAGRKFEWPLDGARVLVPAVAFVGWTMIQTSTTFDAVFDWSGDGRTIIGALLAGILGFVAAALSMRAHKEPKR